MTTDPKRDARPSNGFHELDDLVLHLKGLVLVQDLRERRGAGADELAMYGLEIDRVRERLARVVPKKHRDTTVEESQPAV